MSFVEIAVEPIWTDFAITSLFQLSHCEMLPDQESSVLLSLIPQQLTALHSPMVHV